MSTFHYQIAPATDDGLAASPVLGDQLLQSSLTSAVSAATGVEPLKTEMVIKTFLDQLLRAAGRGQWSPGLYQRIAFRPSCDGRLHSRHGSHSADDIGAGVTLVFTNHAIREWRAKLSPAPVCHEHPLATGCSAGTSALDATEQLSINEVAGLLAAAG